MAKKKLFTHHDRFYRLIELGKAVSTYNKMAVLNAIDTLGEGTVSDVAIKARMNVGYVSMVSIQLEESKAIVREPVPESKALCLKLVPKFKADLQAALAGLEADEELELEEE